MPHYKDHWKSDYRDEKTEHGKEHKAQLERGRKKGYGSGGPEYYKHVIETSGAEHKRDKARKGEGNKATVEAKAKTKKALTRIHKKEAEHEEKDYQSNAKSGHHKKKTEGTKSKTNKAAYTESQKKHIDSKAKVKAPKKSFGTTANVEKAKTALSDRKSKRPGLTRQTVPGA